MAFCYLIESRDTWYGVGVKYRDIDLKFDYIELKVFDYRYVQSNASSSSPASLSLSPLVSGTSCALNLL